MPQQTIDFSLSGDNTTAALVKMDNNVKDHETRIVAVKATADAASSTANTANATANTAKTNAATAQTTADTANTKATNAQTAATAAQTTANAALPKTGQSTTSGLQMRSGSPPAISAIEGAGQSANLALNVTNQGNSAASAVMSFLREGVSRWYFGLDTDNVMKLGNGNSSFIIWHQGNTTVDANNFIKKA